MTYKILLSAFLMSNLSFSQLSVRNAAFIYVKNEVVFVEDDIKLGETTSSIYLRDEGQIIQGDGITGNSGLGSLSVYQKGTVNEYAYNYWCSPVGNTDVDNSGNRAFIPNNNIYEHIGDIDPELDPITSAIAGYTTSVNGTSSPLTISNRWLYSYDPGISYNEWDVIGETGTVNTGYGFTMKGVSGSGSSQLYDFRGKPNNGTIAVNVESLLQTLIGNPYPSALDARDFIHDPLNTPNLDEGIGPTTTGALYFWEQDATVNSHVLEDYRGGYASYTIDSGGSLESFVPATFNSYNGDGTLNTVGASSVTGKIIKRYIPIGQGFMIEGKNGIIGTQQVYFTNGQREYEKESGGNSEFFKHGNIKNLSEGQNDLEYTDEGFKIIPNAYKRFRLNVDFDEVYTRQLLHNFNNSATDGFDYGLESKQIEELSSDAHWILNNEPFVTQAHKFETDLKIPVVINLSAQKNIRFRGLDIQHFDNESIYLYDKEKDIYTDLKSQHYKVNLKAGIYNNRFEITFNQNTSLNISESINESINVFQNNKLSLLSIHNPKLLELKSFSLFDITGKLIQNETLTSVKKQHDISTKSLNTGVFVLKIKLNNGTVVSKKVIIE